jgi:MFS transporter, MHS family, proline/betaine transporter
MTVVGDQAQKSLTREQKEAVGLLSIGTFLEYFDLMLFVHMAVLLNELFFPKTDPFTASLLAAFAFCSTYLLRPVGALIFGYIGDNIGRKHTVIITTLMMSGSCVVMSVLPTYAEIGITASYTIIICRIIQGMSSMGEIIGAQVYLSEIVKRPIQYAAVSFASNFSTVGSMAALGVASLATSSITSFNWRFAFLIGAGIALIGSYARKALRETPEFADARKRLILTKKPNHYKDINIKTVLAYFAIECAYPVWFYILYVYLGQVLKDKFELTSHQVITNNLYVSIVGCIATFIIVYIVRTVHPFKILNIRLAASFVLGVGFLLLGAMDSPIQIMIFQMCIAVFKVTSFPAMSVFFKHFPTLHRFKCSSMVYAMSRTVMSIITTFGMIYLVRDYGYPGICIILFPILIGYAIGLNYFQKLEKADYNR